MIKSYFLTAIRFLQKNRTFSFINILGLATGTVCCLYILLYVQEQFSYDRHYRQAGDIYRVNTSLKSTGDAAHIATTSPPIAPAIKNDFPEVQQYTRVAISQTENRHLLHFKDKSLYAEDAAYVDSTFFDIFTYHFVNGQPADALAAPYSVVLLQPVAEKLFGHTDPVGNILRIEHAGGVHDFKVTGVVDESMGKSHLHANLFFSMNSGGVGEFVLHSDSWATNNFVAAYIKLKPHSSATTLEDKLPAFLQQHGAAQLKAMGTQKVLTLQPIADVHTSDTFTLGLGKTVSKRFLYLLLLIGGLIQLIACINFMNLSTARASKRAKEVGIRKVMGAKRKDLVKQFIGESLLLSAVGVFIAIPLLMILLPWLNQMTQAQVQLSVFADFRLWLLIAALIGGTGLIAGSYPAFYLSAFNSVKVMKGNFSNQISAAGIRRSLVVFQFVLSIVLITGIIIIYSQLNYIRNRDLGFDKDQQLVLSFDTPEAKSKMTALASSLRQLPEIKSAGMSNNYPSRFVFNDVHLRTPVTDVAHAVDAQFMLTDENFTSATGIQLASGRPFRDNDSNRILINETLARQLGLDPKTAEGQHVFTHSVDIATPVNFEIAGVMKDFNYSSLQDAVKPFMLIYDGEVADFSHIILNSNSKNYKALLGKIEGVWKTLLPNVPFEYVFLDEAIQKQYETEMTLSRIINCFTLIAILISCLGLFGLASFSAEQRRKEIGIRKALGASASGIVRLLSGDFLKLVMIALLIATPIAWYAMNKWLSAYAYRVPLQWWMFAAAGSLAIFIALVTVSFQSVRAATVNPVKSLRTE
ncbi:ABC transporter permease [Chitinophaga arvensicola]|uniref:Putative ABC transport system permease protein n=1 Tax=Chitinophaga arvensicola TaxID=29529 RepID=A0A1I0SA07_9BACT|nr:ABC transporter permease [Chitinophaga arvensicola]SEW52966.1 putative ABC transport system permease protein [Chitinophaga arvensicola]